MNHRLLIAVAAAALLSSPAGAVGGDQTKLPSLHSPYWAPNADAVISTATEAMTLLAMDVLKKG